MKKATQCLLLAAALLVGLNAQAQRLPRAQHELPASPTTVA
ncbi:MAG: hypothetical protein EOO62_35775, partial [Hymenobacter sp.]